MDRDAMKAREHERRMDALAQEIKKIAGSVNEIKGEQNAKLSDVTDEIKDIKEMMKQMVEHFHINQEKKPPIVNEFPEDWK